MSEFSKSGPQMPTEQRRQAQVEHQADMRRAADAEHAIRNIGPHMRRRRWWRFWERR